MDARWFVLPLVSAAVLLAQDPEAGRVERHGDRAILIVDSPRPLDSAAITLAQEYCLRVDVEDPPYIFRDDIVDVTAKVSRDPKIDHRVLIPKGGHVEVSFALNRNGRPADPEGLLRALVSAANAQFPFQYRLDIGGGWSTLVPTHSRDALGNIVKITPLLERRVTIPAGTRSIAATANLMSEALSAQTGLRVNCCQGAIAGIPWGMTQISFEAHDEPARDILKRLVRAEAANHPLTDYWLERCDPLPSKWCFINLSHVPGGPPFP